MIIEQLLYHIKWIQCDDLFSIGYALADFVDYHYFVRLILRRFRIIYAIFFSSQTTQLMLILFLLKIGKISSIKNENYAPDEKKRIKE